MEKRRRRKKPRRVPVRYVDPYDNDLKASLSQPVSEETGDGPPPPEQVTEEPVEAEPTAEVVPVEAAEAASESPASRAEADELKEQTAEYEERWKRAAADLENLRKRFDRELARKKMAERETILRAWLDVVDNMERALCANGASSNPWYEGMEAIHQQMLSVLAQFGCTPVVPTGDPFDPEKHEAVAAADLPDEPEGKIVEVTQTGYVLDGKVLRAPKVVVVARGQ